MIVLINEWFYSFSGVHSVWDVSSLDSYLHYVCDECKFKSRTNHKHVCKKDKPAVPVSKSMVFNEQKNLLKKPRQTQWPCYYCPEVFLSQKGEVTHRREVHKPPYKCSECPKSFQTHDRNRDHWRDAHRSVKCEECDKTFSGNGYYAHRRSFHADKNDKKFTCETCPYKSHAQRYLSEHKRFCPGTEMGRQNLLKKHGFIKKTGKFKCHICREEYFKRQGYVLHYRKAHDSFPPELEKIEKVFCDLCPKQFLDRRSLTHHKNLYHPEHCAENYTCDKCDILFSKSRYLFHYRKVHESIPPEFEGSKLFLCHLCPNAYISRGGLDVHVNNSHNRKTKKDELKKRGKKVKKCPDCSKTFLYQDGSSLREHVMVVHKKSTPFKCTHCSKEFGTNVYLKRHERYHTKCYCDICFMELQSAYNLPRHKGEVHGIYPENAIRCNHCPKYFFLKYNYDNHLKKKHPDESNDS